MIAKSLWSEAMQAFASMTENEAVMVVVMEFCDLWSLQRAISKKAFKPHGKFTDQATYVRILSHCPYDLDKVMLFCKACIPLQACPALQCMTLAPEELS